MNFDDHLRLLRLEFVVMEIAAKVGVDLAAANDEIGRIEQRVTERRRYEERLEEDVVFHRAKKALVTLASRPSYAQFPPMIVAKPTPADADRPRA